MGTPGVIVKAASSRSLDPKGDSEAEGWRDLLMTDEIAGRISARGGDGISRAGTGSNGFVV